MHSLSGQFICISLCVFIHRRRTQQVRANCEFIFVVVVISFIVYVGYSSAYARKGMRGVSEIQILMKTKKKQKQKLSNGEIIWYSLHLWTYFSFTFFFFFSFVYFVAWRVALVSHLFIQCVRRPSFLVILFFLIVCIVARIHFIRSVFVFFDHSMCPISIRTVKRKIDQQQQRKKDDMVEKNETKNGATKTMCAMKEEAKREKKIHEINFNDFQNHFKLCSGPTERKQH